MTTLTSRTGTVEFGPGHPVLLINDQLRIIDQHPKVLAELRVGKMDSLLALAQHGQQRGMRAVDILLTHYELDEVAVLPAVARAVHDAIGCAISLDSRNPEALVAALRAVHPYKCLVNSVAADSQAKEGCR